MVEKIARKPELIFERFSNELLGIFHVTRECEIFLMRSAQLLYYCCSQQGKVGSGLAGLILS